MNLPQQSIEQILGSSAVNREFGEKIKELDRRLKMNGMSYPGYEFMTDRQQEILTQGLFLEPESAISMDEYVKTAVDNCGCEDVKEDLYHHSPILMREIETEKEKLPDLKIRIGESLSGLDQAIDLLLEQILQEQEVDPKMAKARLETYVALQVAKVKKRADVIASRGGSHLRFPMDGDLKALNKPGSPFAKAKLKVLGDAPYSLSKKFGTFVIEAKEDITFSAPVKGKQVELVVPKGTQVPYVNNSSGAASQQSGKEITFKTKELTPDSLGLAGKTFDSAQALMKATAAAVDAKYGDRPEITKPLKELLEDANSAKGNKIDLRDALVFGREDLATISKDYGEILAGIWSFNNLEFDKVEFPGVSNEPLIDLYGLKAAGGGGFDATPVSVKSGATGGKVSIVNIIEALAKQNAGNDEAVDNNAEYAMDVFKAVQQNPMRQGMIEIHKLFNDGKGSKVIQDLSKIINISVAEMDLKSISEWSARAFEQGNLQELMDQWYRGLSFGAISDKKMRQRTFEAGVDPRRAIISPLGENAPRLLNDDQRMQDSLTSLARQVILLQAKVNVKKAFLEFRVDNFKDAVFKFNWAGYSAGNKLGYNMKFTN